jgi:hypothetical protein
MIPGKYSAVVFGLLLSGLMSLLVSGITTLRLNGWAAGLVGMWVGAWLTAWLLAFPAVLVVAPLARRLVERLTAGRA